MEHEKTQSIYTVVRKYVDDFDADSFREPKSHAQKLSTSIEDARIVAINGLAGTWNGMLDVPSRGVIQTLDFAAVSIDLYTSSSDFFGYKRWFRDSDQREINVAKENGVDFVEGYTVVGFAEAPSLLVCDIWTVDYQDENPFHHWATCQPEVAFRRMKMKGVVPYLLSAAQETSIARAVHKIYAIVLHYYITYANIVLLDTKIKKVTKIMSIETLTRKPESSASDDAFFGGPNPAFTDGLPKITALGDEGLNPFARPELPDSISFGAGSFAVSAVVEKVPDNDGGLSQFETDLAKWHEATAVPTYLPDNEL